LIRSAVTSAEPSRHGSIGRASWKVGFDGTFRKCTGKYGGEKKGASR
jgi:hypothetical protein